MFATKPFAVAITAIAVGLICALAFESVYDVRMSARRAASDNVSWTGPADVHRSAGQSVPLPLRLVDSGGVGIPFERDWGKDYSHDPKTFHEVILRASPYVDATALERVDADWRAYVARMRDYGNNAIAVPLL